jgi:hypothetical protein
MATYAPKTYAGTTDVYTYTITFPYARKDDLRVFIDDVLIIRGPGANKWQFNTAGTKIIFEDGSEPQDGETLTLRRVTDITDASTVYTAGSGFTYDDINLVLNQLLYAMDELQVAAFDSGWNSAATVESSGYDVPHNLSGAPSRWQITLWCTSGDAGYTTHDIVEFHSMGESPLVWWTSTNLRMETGAASWTIAHGTTAVQTAIDTSKWNIRVQGWR